MIRAIKRVLPVRLKTAVRRLLRNITGYLQTLWQKWAFKLQNYAQERAFWKLHQDQQLVAIPPVSLRIRVTHKHDIATFHNYGQQSLQAFEAALKGIGRDISTFCSILDFGTGCGRLIRWMKPLHPHARLYGCDIDTEAIQWNRKHLPFASIEMNQGLPPLPYADEMFDLVFGLSVFTHLNEDYQDQWLAELKRITKPGAILLLTVHGEHFWKQFAPEYGLRVDITQLNRTYHSNGFFYYTVDGWTGLFPDFYQTMFHKKTYILSHWTDYFEIVDYVEARMPSKQDIVVARKQ
jgi:SAM-dependent methyltransferase